MNCEISLLTKIVDVNMYDLTPKYNKYRESLLPFIKNLELQGILIFSLDFHSNLLPLTNHSHTLTSTTNNNDRTSSSMFANYKFSL